MTEVKGNGSSEKLLPEILEKYLWREIFRKEGEGGRQRPTLYLYILLSCIAKKDRITLY